MPKSGSKAGGAGSKQPIIDTKAVVTLATLAMIGFVAWRVFDPKPAPGVVEASAATSPLPPAAVSPAADFADCVNDARVNEVKLKDVDERSFKAALVKFMSADAKTMTQNESEVVKAALGSEQLTAMIEQCAAKTPSGAFFVATIKVNRANDEGLSSGRLGRTDGLGSCPIDRGVCSMTIVGAPDSVGLRLESTTHRIESGAKTYTLKELRNGLNLKVVRRPTPLTINAFRGGAPVLGTLRLEASVEKDGEFYATGCEAVETQACKQALLSNGRATFEHEAPFINLTVFLSQDGVEKKVAAYTAPVLDTIALFPPPSAPHSLPGHARTPLPCGNSSALYHRIASFKDWKGAGTFAVSAQVEADGRLSHVNVTPALPELADFLQQRPLRATPKCSVNEIATTFEAGT